MKLTNAEVNQFRKIGYISKLIFKDSECEFYKNNFEKVTKICSKIPFENKSSDRIMNPHFFDETSKNYHSLLYTLSLHSILKRNQIEFVFQRI